MIRNINVNEFLLKTTNEFWGIPATIIMLCSYVAETKFQV